MKIELNSHYIHEILNLSKADDISFINKNGFNYIVAHEQEDVTFKNQIIRKLNGNCDNGQTIINRSVLKLLSKDTKVTITDDIIITGNRKIKYIPSKLVDMKINAENHLTTITIDELKHLLNCSYAMSKDEIRPILNGICINKNEFIALDRYRLALRKGDFEIKEPVIVTADLIKVIKKVKYECDVKIYYNDNYVKFKFGDLEIVGYRQQGNYINYNSIIPEDYNTKVTLKIKPILDILKDYKKNKFKVVDLDFQNDKLIIKANNDIATIEESIDIELQGKPLEISFNPDYLIDAFKNYDNATLELINCVSPIVIKENNKLDLVLPVRKK
ncbi:DNA polymerase III subunit beta [Clostridium faecium]